ncbi:MAG: hypothetical protein IJY56_02630 [Clostridia bacterium]|nr:hypothetical protein [Clostridia bacterium]
MKAKNILSLLLAVTLILTLAACTGDTETVSDTSSTYSMLTTTTTKAVSNASVINSKYVTDRTIVAEVNAASKEYGADPTGKTDSTAAIQAAIDYVAFKLKGGTVYLPAGNYRIEGRIVIRPCTTLMGDYVDPDKVKGTDYGTMLWVYTDKRAKDLLSVIQLCGSSAIDGLTVYYPEQKADDPIDYYYTVDSQNGASCRTIKNLTLINSYYGITSPTTGSTGLNTITNLKGSVLNTGLYIYSDADISYYSDFNLSPKYWASMDKSFNPPTEKQVKAAMRKTESYGIKVQNTDRDCFSDIYLDGYTYGMYGEKPDRTAWNGSCYNVNITNADYGVYEEGACTSYGTNFAESKISGDKFAIQNTSNGDVNLYNVTLDGRTAGRIVTLSGEKKTCDEYSTVIPKPAKNTLYNVVKDYGADNTAKSDATAAIQKALDDAKKNGGGIVYVPAGKYQIDGNLTVPAGTMLIGSYYYAASSPTYGTVLYAYSKEKDFITVNGDKSGVVGFQITYPENGVTETEYDKRNEEEYPYTIKCVGKQTYVKSVTLAAVDNGVFFENSDNFIVDRLFMTVWFDGVTVKNSDNGIIHGVHTNVGYALGYTGSGDSRFKDWLHTEKVMRGQKTAASYTIIDYNICYTMTLFTFENSKNIQLIEDFHYGALNFVKLHNSSLYFENVEGSRILRTGGRLFTLTGNSTLSGVNAICYAQQPTFEVEAGSKVNVGNMDVAGKTNNNVSY